MMVERSCDRVFTITRRQAGGLRLEIGRNGYVLTSEDICHFGRYLDVSHDLL